MTHYTKKIVALSLLAATANLGAAPSVYPTGVTRYDTATAYNGYVIFSGQDKKTHLIDMNGNEVHRWDAEGFPPVLLDPALTGGKRGAGKGYFYEPTVLVDVDHTMKAMTEETFGPTLPIMKVADADEAVTLANDSPYGLGAAVFTKDLKRGARVARQIDAGAVCVNDAAINYLALELPMGVWKESGLGVRHGAAGIRKYTRQQALLVSRVPLKRELHYFPYNARVTGLLERGIKLFWGR